MRGHVGHVQEERLAAVVVNELDALVGDQVVDITRDRHAAAALPELEGKLVLGIDRIGVAEELVEALVEGKNRLLPAGAGLAALPLADDCRAVSPALEHSAMVTSSAGKSWSFQPHPV